MTDKVPPRRAETNARAGSGLRRVVMLAAAFSIGLAVVLSLAAGADAAAFTCQPNVLNPAAARASGIAEQTGDLILNCTGGTPTSLAASIPGYDITILTNAPTTSRLLADRWAEPLLLLDEPPSGSGTPCQSASGVCTNKGNGTGDATASNYYIRNGGQNFDVFQGQVGSSSVTFKGVPLDPPPMNGMRVVRITNIRMNASEAPSGGPGPTPLVESVGIAGSGAPTVSNPQQTVAFAFPGLTYSTLTAQGDAPLSSPVALSACADERKVQVATLQYSEVIANGFKKRDVATSLTTPLALSDQSAPGATYNTETGFYDHTFVGNAARGDLSIAGLADFGTRLKATFSAVPAGARLFVDTQSTGGQMVASFTTSESGPYSAAGAGGTMSEVPLVNGSGTAVWEVLDANPSASDKLRFGVYVDVPANTATPGGTATVSGNLAPTSTTGAASTGPVPRFVDTSSATPFMSVPPCAGPPPPPPGGATTPVVQSASARPTTFAVDPRGPGEVAVSASAARRAPRGTTFRYALSEAGRTTFTIKRRSSGRRSGKRCVKPTRKNRSKKRCVRSSLAGRFALDSAAGANQHHFSGRIGARKLKPGRFRVTLVASNADNKHSAPKSFNIKVVPK